MLLESRCFCQPAAQAKVHVYQLDKGLAPWTCQLAFLLEFVARAVAIGERLAYSLFCLSVGGGRSMACNLGWIASASNANTTR